MKRKKIRQKAKERKKKKIENKDPCLTDGRTHMPGYRDARIHKGKVKSGFLKKICLL